ncbi:MAG: hypothetical protein HQL69_18280 [Magnetococcales bacterium]|nr:hypothetical protein [Magnetococcales bacterium]
MYLISCWLSAIAWGSLALILSGGYAGLRSHPWIGYIFWLLVVIGIVAQLYTAWPGIMHTFHSYRHPHHHNHA